MDKLQLANRYLSERFPSLPHLPSEGAIREFVSNNADAISQDLKNIFSSQEDALRTIYNALLLRLGNQNPPPAPPSSSSVGNTLTREQVLQYLERLRGAIDSTISRIENDAMSLRGSALQQIEAWRSRAASMLHSLRSELEALALRGRGAYLNEIQNLRSKVDDYISKLASRAREVINSIRQSSGQPSTPPADDQTSMCAFPVDQPDRDYCMPAAFARTDGNVYQRMGSAYGHAYVTTRD